MSELPTKQSEFLTYCQNHVPMWASTPTAVGLTAAQCTAATALVTNTAKLFNAADVARIASKGATQDNDNAFKSLRSDMSDLIKTIKAFASMTNDPNVYTKAGINPPAPPSPAPAPAKPDNLAASLENNGAVTLLWRCTNPAGGTVTYSISRKLPGDTVFSLIATTGGIPSATGSGGRRGGRRGLKQWTDATLPANASGVQYVIQGFRGDVAGPTSEMLTVTFGADSGGGMVLSTKVEEAPAMKMAA